MRRDAAAVTSDLLIPGRWVMKRLVGHVRRRRGGHRAFCRTLWEAAWNVVRWKALFWPPPER